MSIAETYHIDVEKQFISESVNYSLLLLQKKLISQQTYTDYMTALKLRKAQLEKEYRILTRGK